jgi:Cu/Ag efflux pump CusA
VGKELELPLAQVVLGGLVTATVLNLLVVPVVYFRIESRRDLRVRSIAPAPSSPQESMP